VKAARPDLTERGRE